MSYGLVALLPLSLISLSLPFVRANGLRRSIIAGALVWCAIVACGTELLGAFGLLYQAPLVILWSVVCMAGVALGFRQAPRTGPTGKTIEWKWSALNSVEKACAAGIASVLLPVAVLSLAGAPTVPDAMYYHLPRVVFWAQSGNVDFFPTNYPPQLYLQPFQEYVLLQTFLLSGSDAWVNAVQWCAFAGCIVAVTLIASEMGVGRQGQLVSALFCATVPNAILQASGTKNDLLLAFLLACMAYFALSYIHRWGAMDLWAAASALALALLTKGTAYLFAPVLLIAILTAGYVRARFSVIRVAGAIAVTVLLFNGLHYARCLHYSGSPLGLGSAYSDGAYRFNNDGFGVRVTLSNVIRNLGLHFLQIRGVHGAIVRAHSLLKTELYDPATTWQGSTFSMMGPWCETHESCAPSPAHTVLVLLAAPALYVVRRRVPLLWVLYYAGLAGMFVSFCVVLRWQPWHTRMHVPILLLGSALIGALSCAISRTRLTLAVVVILSVLAQPAVYTNYSRPLRGPDSILNNPRDTQYFLHFRSSEPAYRAAAELIAQAECDVIGIDNSHAVTADGAREPAIEYPLLALARQARPNAKFVHVGVDNPSLRYADNALLARPCVIVCPTCASNPVKSRQYESGATASAFDEAVVYLPADSSGN